MTQSRNHKVKVDYGIEDYYRFFKKNNKGTSISRATYGSILKEYNGFVRDNISKRGIGYKFPLRMGNIELRKKKSSVTVNEDGSIKNTMAVNWQKTRKLWDENPKAAESEVKVRFTNEHSDGYIFKITYMRGKAVFKNKKIYLMRMNRQMKRDLSQSIMNKSIDAFVNIH